LSVADAVRGPLLIGRGQAREANHLLSAGANPPDGFQAYPITTTSQPIISPKATTASSERP
jgi:hypothetical protein